MISLDDIFDTFDPFDFGFSSLLILFSEMSEPDPILWEFRSSSRLDIFKVLVPCSRKVPADF